MDKNKKKDTLLVKDDASQEFIYHYSREERLAHRKKVKSDNKKGLFRNKILLIIVCDIILVVLIFLFIQSPLFNSLGKEDSPIQNIGSYHITLSGYRIKDKVFARLYIERTKDKEKKENEKEDIVHVRFSVNNESALLKEKLPGSAGEGIHIRHTLVSSDKNKELNAQVTIGEKTETLHLFPEER